MLGTVDAAGMREAEGGATSFQKTNGSGDRLLFSLRQTIPPNLKFVRELDFPGYRPPSAGNRIIASKEYSIMGIYLLLESSEDCLQGRRYNFRREWMAGTAALGIWRSELRELDIRERIREELLFEVYSKWIDKIANQRGGDKIRRLAARHLPERPIRPSEPESEQPRQAQCGPKPFLVLELVARPTGIEPVSRASETLILSIELRAQRKEAVLYPVFAELHELDQIFRQTQRKPRRLHWTRVYDTVI